MFVCVRSRWFDLDGTAVSDRERIIWASNAEFGALGVFGQGYPPLAPLDRCTYS